MINFLLPEIISFSYVFLNDLRRVVSGFAILAIESCKGVDFHEYFFLLFFFHSEFLLHVIADSSKGHADEQELNHWIDASFF